MDDLKEETSRSLAGYGEERFHSLRYACGDAYRRLQPFRMQALEMTRAYVGRFGDSAITLDTRDRTPLNLMQLAIGIYRRQVAAREPRFNVVASDPARTAVAADFEGALNATVRQARLKDAVDAAVTCAMFAMGVVKVGLEDGGERFADERGTAHDAGRPFVECVHLDNFVYDMKAPSWDKVRFAGDAFEVTPEAAREMGWDVAVPDNRNIAVNPGGDDATIALQAGNYAQFGPDRYHETVRCWELWLPHDGVVLYMQADQSGGFYGGRYLGHRKYAGRPHGPYHVLQYDRVPGVATAVPPASALVDLHYAVNDSLRKELDMAQRKKKVGIVNSPDAGNAAAVNESKDGEVVCVQGGVQQEIIFGGADPNGIVLATQLREMFSYLGGNLDAIGGLSRTSNTVGQESIISRGANARIAFMQECVLGWITEIGKHLGMLVWENPGKGPSFQKRVGGENDPWSYEFPATFDVKEGDFEDYGISIEPYSMQSRTPSERVAEIMEVMTTTVLPLAPNLQAQGKKIDLPRLMATVAKYKSLPELNHIVTDMTEDEVAMMRESGGGERPTQSPVTRRESVRTSVSGTRGPSESLQVMKALSQSQ